MNNHFTVHFHIINYFNTFLLFILFSQAGKYLSLMKPSHPSLQAKLRLGHPILGSVQGWMEH